MIERMQVVAQNATIQEFVPPAANARETTNVAPSYLTAWAELTPFRPDPKRMRKNRIVSFSQTHAANTNIDMMRTNIRHALQRNNWTTIAITSPAPSCGKSMLCTNLAFSLSRSNDWRTVLIDLDFRRPQIGDILGLRGMDPVERFLNGRSPMERVFSRCEWNSSEERLAVASASAETTNCAELLQSDSTTRALDELKRKLQPHVILYDLPPMLLSDDLLSFLPNVDCVMLVAAAESSTVQEIDSCERELAERTNFLGVVLNKCRYSPEKYGYY